MKNIKTSLALLLTLGATALPASAHDAWVQVDGAQAYSVRFGHGNELQAFAPAKIRAVRALDAKGRALALRQQPAAADKVTLSVQGRPALWLLEFDNGYWSKAPDSTVSQNLPRTEVPGAVSGSHAVKFGKTVIDWSALVTRPQGQRLEIVPLQGAAPRAGQKLALQVLWDGRPLPQARLLREGAPQGEPAVEADAQGRAEVAVVAGWQMLTVNRRVPLLNEPRADTYSAGANLVFHAQ